MSGLSSISRVFAVSAGSLPYLQTSKRAKDFKFLSDINTLRNPKKSRKCSTYHSSVDSREKQETVGGRPQERMPELLKSAEPSTRCVLLRALVGGWMTDG